MTAEGCPACGNTGQKESVNASAFTCTNDNCRVWFFTKEEVSDE